MAEAAASKRAHPTLLPQGATTREKAEKTGNETDAKFRTALLQPGVLTAIAETPALSQMGEILTGGSTGEGPLGDLTSSIATLPQAVALPSHLLAAGMVPGRSGSSDIPHISECEVAFALRLTWKPSPSATEPVVYSGPVATLSPDPINGSNIPDTTDKPTDLREVQSQDSVQIAEEPVQGNGQLERSSRSWSQPESVLSAVADSVIGGAESRPPEMSAMISQWNMAARFQLQNDVAIAGWKSLTTVPSTTPYSKAFTSLEASVIPAEIDTQTRWLGKATEPVLARTGPESRVSAARDIKATETAVRTETATSHATEPEESRLTESGTSPHRREATPAATAPNRPGAPKNDVQDTLGRDAENIESNGKASRLPLMQKLSQIRNSHEPAGVALDGLLLVRPTESGAGPQTRIEVRAAQPPQVPIASPETEAPSALQQSQPIREISLRLAGAASAHVDVQVAERAGRVQVAVRTADQDLARSLQSNLGELIGRLEEKGFRTEAWTPITVTHGGLAIREPSTLADSRSQSDGSGSQGGQPDSRQGHQESNQRQQGRWRAQFEETLSMPKATT